MGTRKSAAVMGVGVPDPPFRSLTAAQAVAGRADAGEGEEDEEEWMERAV